jgi:hypothetical protein
MATSNATSAAKVVPDVDRACRELGKALAADVGDRSQLTAVYAFTRMALEGMGGPLAVGRLDEESTFVLHSSGVDIFRILQIGELNVEVERRPLPPLHGGTYVETIELYPDPHVVDETFVRLRVRAQYSHDALGSAVLVIRQRDASTSVPDDEQSMFELLRTWSRTIDPRVPRADNA